MFLRDKKFHQFLIKDYLANYFELQDEDSYNFLIKELNKYKENYEFKTTTGLTT